MKRPGILGIAALSLIVIGSARSSYGSTSDEMTVGKAVSSEQQERDVDEVALASQEKSISKLSTLLNKYRSTAQEPVLLAKLADLQQQNASILFRIAHGQAHRKQGEVDLSRFNKVMNQSIVTLTTLITAYPHFAEIPHAYFLRGKGYEEIENKKAAALDYLTLVGHFPEAEEAVSAYMSLAEFAIQENDHPRAISYLKEVEKHPDDPHYPFALYKLAWSYYNLKNIPASLSYAERQVSYYNANKIAGIEEVDTASSDAALRENTLLDVTVFYFEGYEQKLPRYELNQALAYFKGLEEGPVLGKMLVRFAKLLRAHEYQQDLIAWKDQIIETYPNRPEGLDVAIAAYEFLQNRRDYTKLIEVSKDFVSIYKRNNKFESFPRAQTLLLDTADGLQALIIKNKNATDIAVLSAPLAAIYDAFTKVVEDTDARIPRVHYNLAETLFTIRDYPGATEHYRWVVTHYNRKWGDSVPDAALKAIASRYEVLAQKQLIPKQLSVTQAALVDPKMTLDPLLSEWIGWVDAESGQKDVQKNLKIETFRFEADRALYAQGLIVQATQRLKDFAEHKSLSEYAIPAASLVIDTAIAGAEWDRVLSLTKDFSKIKDWKSPDFRSHLTAVAADAYYKKIEIAHAAHDYPTTLKLADQFLKDYSSSARLADALALAGAAALAGAEKDRALDYFTRLIKDAPRSGSVATALIARASLEEESYHFESAASDYSNYLALPKDLVKTVESGAHPNDPKVHFEPETHFIDDKQADGLRRKVLFLNWLSGNSLALKGSLDSKVICTDNLASECDKFLALSLLNNPAKAQDETVTADAFERARKSTGETRAVWAALALEGAKTLAFRDRLLAARYLSTNWEDLDPLVKFSLVPFVSNSLPRAFRLARISMPEVAPLRANEKYITHRVDVIKEMENAATQAINLPWARIRAGVLNEIAAAYIDLARGLDAVPPPKGLTDPEIQSYQDTIRRLTLPFEEKGQEMRGKAFEIASRFAIESDSMNTISEPFFAENPSQAKALRTPASPGQRAPINLELLGRLDPLGGWSVSEVAESKDPIIRMKQSWIHAIRLHHWQQVAFFLQEAQKNKLLQKGTIGLVKSISLAAVGAQGEALTEMDQAKNELTPDVKFQLNVLLLQYFTASYAQDKIKTLQKELEPPKPLLPEKKQASAGGKSTGS